MRESNMQLLISPDNVDSYRDCLVCKDVIWTKDRVLISGQSKWKDNMKEKKKKQTEKQQQEMCVCRKWTFQGW